MSNQIVKEQFNKQAEKFADWEIGKNVEYLNGYFDFCDIQSSDRLLDVACGPGEYVNDYFETFDKLVDISHNKTLAEFDFNKLYSDNKINKTGEFRLDVDLNVKEYIDHAIQDEESKLEIVDFLNKGQEDKRLVNFLFIRDNDLYFKRHVYLIIGKK